MKLTFVVNLISWYGFTVLSTIYSKNYLDLVNDAHALTLISLCYPAIFRLLYGFSRTDLFNLLKNGEFTSLAFFNIGTILFTYIGMSETSVSLVYMVKVKFSLYQS